MSDGTYNAARICQFLAQPQSAVSLFGYVRDGLIREIGCGLMTASLYDLQTMRTRRVFTDNDAAYALGNFKRLDRNRFYQLVVEAAKPFSSTTIEELAEVFFDWEHIQALGYGSNLNVPAVANGKVLGTINLLEKTGHYTPDRVAAAMKWQPLVTLSFLLLVAEGPESANFLGRPTSQGAITEGARQTHEARPHI
jgi:GAF domain-containing protein|tara:strand:+ start:25863 stop:26447 length:585 start_codon:yes stop_codon:yes gene_type:complete